MSFPRFLCSLALTLVFSFGSSAFATSKEIFLVAIKKGPQQSCDHLLDGEIEDLLGFLNYEDPTFGNEYVTAQTSNFVNLCDVDPSASYLGMVQIEIEYTSTAKRDFYLSRLEQNGRYIAFKPLIP